MQLAATSVVCDGKAKEPAVASVVLDEKTLAAGTDFTVSYADNVAPGTATVTVTGVGAYAGSAKATFAIRLGKAKIATVARPGAKAGSAVYTGALTRTKSSVKVTGKKGVKTQSAQSQGSGSALTAAAI